MKTDYQIILSTELNTKANIEDCDRELETQGLKAYTNKKQRILDKLYSNTKI